MLRESGHAEHVRLLSISQRVTLMRTGLQDRDASVKAACVALLTQSWLKKVEFNVLELLKLMGVEHFPADAERVVRAVLESGSAPAMLTATPKPPYALAQLDPEHALYWRVLAVLFFAISFPNVLNPLITHDAGV